MLSNPVIFTGIWSPNHVSGSGVQTCRILHEMGIKFEKNFVYSEKTPAF